MIQRFLFQVLYFRDFSACPISQSSLKALTSIDWRSYGLTLANVENQGGNVLIEWENLPTNAHIDIVLHLHNEQYPALRHTLDFFLLAVALFAAFITCFVCIYVFLDLMPML